MNRSEIISQVASYINQSMAGLEIENSKFDFKRKWYDLKTEPGISEFIKDSSAIANTFGPDGFIVIGYDEKLKQLSPSKFSDSGFNDVSDITNLINKKMDRLFHVDVYEELLDETPISIIHIPPSFDKPHIIKCHKTFPQGNLKEEIQRIFVRNGTTAKIASKSDIELMYWDRKNVVPDYLLYCHSRRSSFRLNIRHAQLLCIGTILYANISIENAGKRAISIIQISFNIYDPVNLGQIITLTTGAISPIIFQPGIISPISLTFNSNFLNGKSYKNANDEINRIAASIDSITIGPLNFLTSNGKDMNFELVLL